MTVNVHGLKTPHEITAYYGTESKKDAFQTVARAEKGYTLPDGRLIYHLELTGLKPDTLYYCCLGTQEAPLGEPFCFRTVPQEGKTLFFVEGGDWENSPEAAQLARKAASLAPLAIFLGGDYPSKVFGLASYKKWDQWLDVYEKHMVTPTGCLIPLVMAIGNHEVIGGFGQPKSCAPFFFKYFAQAGEGKSFFSLCFGKKVSLFVLDSGHVASHGGEQKAWLERELKKSINTTVKIALYHVPLYPSIRFVEKNANYHSLYGIVRFFKGENVAEKLYSREGEAGRLHWLPLFDAYQMTVAFEHHDQALKRTKLLKDNKEDPKGTLYLGDGGWGSKLQFPPIQGFFHSYFAALTGGQHFFWTIKIEEKKVTYEAVTASGKIIDHFIQKYN
jgi:hypothetical protein